MNIIKAKIHSNIKINKQEHIPGAIKVLTKGKSLSLMSDGPLLKN